MHRFLPTPSAGARFPSLVLDGWGAGESVVRSHPVPAPGARWTLVLLSRSSRPDVEEHRARLAAEAVSTVVVAGTRQVHAAVLVDSAGTVQHVADSVEDALDTVAALRTGRRAPLPAAPRPARCPAEGRFRRAARVAGRRAA